jgi:FKBP-type peptidyl-prolyl cis-trans isomerase
MRTPRLLSFVLVLTAGSFFLSGCDFWGEENPQVTIEEISTGTGDEALVGSLVQLNYTLFLEDGTQIETTVDGEPMNLRIGYGEPVEGQDGAYRYVIPGFHRGVVGMKEGGIRRVIVPPGLAYGDNDVKDNETDEIIIPANSTIEFEIELLHVE